MCCTYIYIISISLYIYRYICAEIAGQAVVGCIITCCKSSPAELTQSCCGWKSQPCFCSRSFGPRDVGQYCLDPVPHTHATGRFAGASQADEYCMFMKLVESCLRPHQFGVSSTDCRCRCETVSSVSIASQATRHQLVGNLTSMI